MVLGYVLGVSVRGGGGGVHVRGGSVLSPVGFNIDMS